jgi:hypothetical protein
MGWDGRERWSDRRPNVTNKMSRVSEGEMA